MSATAFEPSAATSSSNLPNDDPNCDELGTVSPSRVMVDCQDEFHLENELDEVMEESVPIDSIEPPEPTEPPKALINDHDYLKWPNESDQTAMSNSQNGSHNSAI